MTHDASKRRCIDRRAAHSIRAPIPVGSIADLTFLTSRRIELQVGRDLQWIRVNGTVVGGLAGLIIYTVAQLIG